MCKCTQSQRFCSFLCIIFGLGTWMPTDAIFCQIPNLTAITPEGWNLSSYFVLTVQIANIGSFLYYLFHKKLSSIEPLLVVIFLMVGTISMIGISMTFKNVIFVFNEAHSVPFFFFSFLAALLGCISSLLFIPFMYRLPEKFLVTFFIGQGFSGFIPSILTGIQGFEKGTFNNGTQIFIETLLNPTNYFFVIGCCMLICTMSFVYLNYCTNFVEKTHISCNQNEKNNESNVHNQISTNLSRILLVVLSVLNCFSNGILPSISTYSCLPYGKQIYHWSAVLNQCVNFIIVPFTSSLPILSKKVLSVAVIALSFCIVYIFLTAIMSPKPTMVGTTMGSTLIIIFWTTETILSTYVKMSIAAIFRQQSKVGLFNYGLVTQLGAFIGSVLSFIMINYWKIFTK